jgi:mercuric ion transport protein
VDHNSTRNASLGGAIAAAVAASACCIGPLVFALLGIGGAGFLVALEPYRPVFTVVTVGLLSIGWSW